MNLPDIPMPLPRHLNDLPPVMLLLEHDVPVMVTPDVAVTFRVLNGRSSGTATIKRVQASQDGGQRWLIRWQVETESDGWTWLVDVPIRRTPGIIATNWWLVGHEDGPHSGRTYVLSVARVARPVQGMISTP